MSVVYRLALDMDTGTLGWALWELSPERLPVKIADWGVQVFSEGRDPMRNGRTVIRSPYNADYHGKCVKSDAETRAQTVYH